MKNGLGSHFNVATVTEDGLEWRDPYDSNQKRVRFLDEGDDVVLYDVMEAILIIG